MYTNTQELMHAHKHAYVCTHTQMHAQTHTHTHMHTAKAKANKLHKKKKKKKVGIFQTCQTKSRSLVSVIFFFKRRGGITLPVRLKRGTLTLSQKEGNWEAELLLFYHLRLNHTLSSFYLFSFLRLTSPSRMP